MSDVILNDLNKLENNIYDVSEFFKVLFNIMNNTVVKGDIGNQEGNEELLETIVNTLSTIKENMHKKIEVIYTENTFENKSKHLYDQNEQIVNIKNLNLIFNKLKGNSSNNQS
jgi:hypothetical protein